MKTFTFDKCEDCPNYDHNRCMFSNRSRVKDKGDHIIPDVTPGKLCPLLDVPQEPIKGKNSSNREVWKYILSCVEFAKNLTGRHK